MTSAIEIIPPVVIGDRSPWTQDEQDRLWLADRTATVEQSLRSLADAVVQISRNWTSGRKVGRFYPDLSAFEYLIEEIGPIRLPREERDKFISGLIDAGHSRRKAAELAGVTHETANKVARNSHPLLTDGQKLAKHVRGAFTGKAVLPGEIDRWLANDPPASERVELEADLRDLARRIGDLIEKVKVS